MRSRKSILRECFLGVIDFNEEAALDAMKRYAELYHESKVKKISFNLSVMRSLRDGDLHEVWLQANENSAKDFKSWVIRQ